MNQPLYSWFPAVKLSNARASLQRSARVSDDPQRCSRPRRPRQPPCEGWKERLTLNAARGIEGAAARAYFGVLGQRVRQEREAFAPNGRTRRPPLDRMNCLLSFLYALLLADCTAALAGVGLDPYVGFLHGDRPGKPSLALDLMEEFRPLLADRLALTLVNRKQVRPEGFMVREGGVVEMFDATRRDVVAAWRERKLETVTHVLLERQMPVGLLIHTQARILARHIRGDVPEYVPCTLK